MTLKEADAAAQRMSQIRNLKNGIVYSRILNIGYHYNEKGCKMPFICVQDRNAMCVEYANPADCEEVTE